jgi:hypothetical protein
MQVQVEYISIVAFAAFPTKRWSQANRQSHRKLDNSQKQQSTDEMPSSKPA